MQSFLVHGMMKVLQQIRKLLRITAGEFSLQNLYKIEPNVNIIKIDILLMFCDLVLVELISNHQIILINVFKLL